MKKMHDRQAAEDTLRCRSVNKTSSVVAILPALSYQFLFLLIWRRRMDGAVALYMET